MSDLNMNINYSYPNNPLYDIDVCLERINLDEERKRDIKTNNGFIITADTKSVKKDVKDINGIYSTRFGQTLQDVNAFANRYKCKCGHLEGRIYYGVKCPICGEKVKFIDDNFEYFGWIVLKDPYYIIHPALYSAIESFFGASTNSKSKDQRLNNIIKVVDEKDEDGFTRKLEKESSEPFYGIGMIDFVERFDEIMEFYLKKYPNKKDKYDSIMKDRDKVFTQSIPVYTTQLRPFSIEGRTMSYEDANTIYSVMVKLAAVINRDNLKIFRKKKPKNQCLYDLQTKFNELYKEQIKILATKKGEIRQNFGGRYNFSARSVIAQDPMLGIDEIRLPYHALVELYQPTIINILKKSLGIPYSEAHRIWYKSQITKNQRVWDILENLIKDSNGLPMLINRNPTINYGSILFMRCVGINDNYTMSVPLQPLKPLNADFDGDALNILSIINKAFAEKANQVFNPRNAMMISHNDGYFESALNHEKDVLIITNSLIELSRKYYTDNDIEKIKQLQAMK